MAALAAVVAALTALWGWFGWLVLAWYILMELGSITENVGKMGAPVPPWLRRAIAILKDTVDEAGNKIAPEETERKDE